jgi:SAM-dependent methyltransferase
MNARSCNLCGSTACAHLFTKAGFDLVRCGSCELVYVSKPPSGDELQKLYSFESGYQKELVDDPISTAFHHDEAARNLALLQKHARPGRLLDVGCSTGLFLTAAKQAGWQARGVEYSADSSRVAREVYGQDVVTGALEPGMFEPGSFDVVTFWDVIEHVPDPVYTLGVAAELLAPGGLMVLKTPNVDGLYPKASLALASRLGFWGHPEPPGHLFQFSEKTLSRLAAGAGLQPRTTVHQRIPLNYSFGTPREWLRSVKWAVYCAAFLPMAVVGPWLGRGDDIALIAAKPRA